MAKRYGIAQIKANKVTLLPLMIQQISPQLFTEEKTKTRDFSWFFRLKPMVFFKSPKVLTVVYNTLSLYVLEHIAKPQ